MIVREKGHPKMPFLIGAAATKMRSIKFCCRIDTLAQFFSRFEVRYPFFLDHHFFAGAGIASDARRPDAQCKTAKTTNFDTLTIGQSASHGIQYGFYCQFGVFGE